jgi:hypothetical protein
MLSLLRGCLDVRFTYGGSAYRSARFRRWAQIHHPLSFKVAEFLHATGVHSLERSAQEDTLLVLFNTAISNLVSQPLHRRYCVLNIILIVGSLS